MTYAYSVTQSIPADSIKLSANDLSLVLKAEGFGSHGPDSINDWDNNTLNKHNSYAETFSNTTQPDIWHVRDDAFDVVTYKAVGNGLEYDTTFSWRQMDYVEAKKQARDIIEAYYIEYANSYFTAAQQWFSAAPERQINYLKTDAFVRLSVRNVEEWERLVIDAYDNVHRFSTEAEWDGFLRKWENLDTEAQNVADSAWTDVKDADPGKGGGGTDAVVQAIIDMKANNPVPTLPPEE